MKKSKILLAALLGLANVISVSQAMQSSQGSTPQQPLGQPAVSASFVWDNSISLGKNLDNSANVALLKSVFKDSLIAGYNTAFPALKAAGVDSITDERVKKLASYIKSLSTTANNSRGLVIAGDTIFGKPSPLSGGEKFGAQPQSAPAVVDVAAAALPQQVAPQVLKIDDVPYSELLQALQTRVEFQGSQLCPVQEVQQSARDAASLKLQVNDLQTQIERQKEMLLSASWTPEAVKMLSEQLKKHQEEIKALKQQNAEIIEEKRKLNIAQRTYEGQEERVSYLEAKSSQYMAAMAQLAVSEERCRHAENSLQKAKKLVFDLSQLGIDPDLAKEQLVQPLQMQKDLREIFKITEQNMKPRLEALLFSEKQCQELQMENAELKTYKIKFEEMMRIMNPQAAAGK